MTALETLLNMALRTFDEDALLLLLRDDCAAVNEAAAFRLHHVGREKTFQWASAAAGSPRWQERYLAAFVLGQLGYPEYPFVDASEPVLVKLLESDRSSKVRAAAAVGLGHLGRGLEALARASADRNAQVRRSVGAALSTYDTDPRVHAALTRLNADPDPGVRESAAPFPRDGIDEANGDERFR